MIHRHVVPLAAMVAAALLSGCPDDTKPRLYKSYDTPPAGLYTDSTPALWDQTEPGTKIELTQDLIGGMQVLGAQLVVDSAGSFRGVNFSVYSQRAEKVRLLLFDDPESNKATRQFDLARLSGSDVWNVYVEGVGLGQHYGYAAWGPNWQFDPSWYPGSILGFHSDVDVAGNRFNPNKLLFDPYCKIFNRGHDWSKGSAGTGPDRIALTYAAAMKCRVVKSDFAWSPEEGDWQSGRVADSLDGHHVNDLILYEVHPKGFTANTSSGAVHYGTFRGFAEKADYFKDLGVTAIELLPPFDKADDAGYWGYNTLGYFAPEHSYLAKNEMASGIDEFKSMVDELHYRGVEVILDVVYNHSGEGGLWRQKIYTTDDQSPWNLDPTNIASLFGFRGLDNAMYYALPPGDGTQYCDYTGVGNTMRNNSPPMQRMIIDSLRYWVAEMHVDGFRFDLAPALGAKDGQYDNCPTSANHNGGGIAWDPKTTMVQTVIDDPVLQKHNARIIAEPWGGGGYPVGQFPMTSVADKPGYAWGEWNNQFRDWWRSFVNYSGYSFNNPVYGNGSADGGGVMTGTDVLYKQNGRAPYASVNFVTCHDGMTMYDVLSYDKKVNGCSPLNPNCCNNPLSSFCQEAENSGTDDNKSYNWSKAGDCCAGDGDCDAGCGANGICNSKSCSTNDDCPTTKYCRSNQCASKKSCGFGSTCYDHACVDSEAFKRQLMRNFFVAMMVSHGTPMIFGGDEWMRTQLGNNNTYTPEADNAYSWHDWGFWQGKDDRWRMYDFLRQAIELRKGRADVLAPTEYGTFKDTYWRNADGSQKTGDGWKARTVLIDYSDRNPELLVLINMEDYDVSFTLPAGKSFDRLVDTQMFFDSADYLNAQKLELRASANASVEAPVAVPGSSYGVKSRTMVVLEAK